MIRLDFRSEQPENTSSHCKGRARHSRGACETDRGRVGDSVASLGGQHFFPREGLGNREGKKIQAIFPPVPQPGFHQRLLRTEHKINAFHLHREPQPPPSHGVYTAPGYPEWEPLPPESTATPKIRKRRVLVSPLPEGAV